MATSTGRGLGTWPEDSDDLRRIAEILGQLTLDTRGRNAGVSLDLLITPAVALVPTAHWASVTTLSNGRFRTVACSDDTAAQIDLLQYEHGTGPCVDAVLGGGIFTGGDVAQETRWHPLGAQVREAFGVNSMLALRLHLLDESDTVAGLNFSSTTPHAFSQADMDRARILATHSALLVTATQAQNKAANLLKALESNREIGVAIGVLMARHGPTREQAFDVLRHASQNTNRRLAHVAAEVAETGAHPQTA